VYVQYRSKNDFLSIRNSASYGSKKGRQTPFKELFPRKKTDLAISLRPRYSINALNPVASLP
jgi:hypothetical protein